MQTVQNIPEIIEVKRGGLAQYFIYIPFIILLGLINTIFKIPPPYLYYVFMVTGVVAVMSMNTLSSLVFTKVIIRVTKEGIWTDKLSLVPWNNLKDIRLEKTSTFNAGNMTSTSAVDLIIETMDGRESSFWGGFLNRDATQLCDSLNNFWKSHK